MKHHAHKPPADHPWRQPQAKLKIGDLVQTPLGRIARITGIMADGAYLDAEYVGASPTQAATTLQPKGLIRLDKFGNRLPPEKTAPL